MSHFENGGRRHKAWSEWSIGAKVAVIAAGIVFVPALLALCATVTMWLWNWLMPAIFRLPAIGFWQAVGIIILSQILFKGGHVGRAGRSHWKKARMRESMREPEPGAEPETKTE
jgi:hypothetical protein